MDFNGLFKFWFAQGEKRLALQISCKEGEPQPTKRNRHDKIKPTGQGAGSKFRPRGPEEIDQTHDDEQHGHFGKQAGAALQIARKQHEKGRKKMENQQEDGDEAPTSVQPAAIKADLVRQISRPDDQQLREGKIGPQHHESQQQLAEIAQVTSLDQAGHRGAPGEQDRNGDYQAQSGDDLSYYEN